MEFRRSTYSGENGNNCVEVARQCTVVGIRDSKHEAAELLMTPSVFARFLDIVKNS